MISKEKLINLAKLLVNFYFLYFFLSNYKEIFSSLREILNTLSLSWFLAFLALEVLEFELQVVRFYALSYKKLNLKEILRLNKIYLFGHLFAFIMPVRALGELVRIEKLNPFLRDYYWTLKLIFWERVLDVLLLVSVIIAYFLFSLIKLSFLLVLFLAFLSGLFLLLKFQGRISFMLKKISKFFIGKEIEISMNPKQLKFPFLLTYLLWLVDFFRVYAIFNYFSAKIPFEKISTFVALSYLSIIFSILPGGLLVFEGVLIKLTEGISKSVAFEATFLERFYSYWLIIIVGGILYFLELFRKKDENIASGFLKD